MWKDIVSIIALPVRLPMLWYLRWQLARRTAEHARLLAELKKRGDKLSEEDERKLAELRARLWPDGNVPPDCQGRREGSGGNPSL